MKRHSLDIMAKQTRMRVCAVLFTTVASLTAWAGYGFFDNGTANIKMNYLATGAANWTDNHWACASGGCGRTSGHTDNIGNIDQLYLKEWWVKTWKNGSGDICEASLCYYVETVSSTAYYGNNGVEGSTDQVWKNTSMNINVLDIIGKNPDNTTYKAGLYKLNYFFRMRACDNSCNQGCSNWVYSNTNANYHTVQFTVSGFSPAQGESMNFGRVRVGDNESITNEYTMYGSTTITTSKQDAITGTDANQFEIVGDIESDQVTVKFKPTTTGLKTATLTLTDDNGKTYTCTLTGNGISNESTTVYISKNPIVTNIKDVELFGYLKYTGCPDASITDYGFYYTTDQFTADFCSGGTKLQASNVPTALNAKGTFSATEEFLTAGTYYYKSYAVADGECVVSDETRSFTIEQIIPNVALTCTSSTVTPYEWVNFSAAGENYVGNLLWTVTSEGDEGEMEVTVVSSTSETMRLKLPRPSGTAGTTFTPVTYTITVKAVNGDESAEDSCTITLVNEADEGCDD